MAANKLITARYSKHLDSMTAWIKDFMSSTHDRADIMRTHKGIADFCYKNSGDFRKVFLKKAGLKTLGYRVRAKNATKLQSEFVTYMARLRGECVFLLMDTYDALTDYQAKTGKGLGLLINRNFLSGSNKEEDYFILISLIYRSLQQSHTQSEFLSNYIRQVRNLIRRNAHFAEKANEIYAYTFSSQ